MRDTAPAIEYMTDAAALWTALGFVNDRHDVVAHLAANLALRDADKDALILQQRTEIATLTETMRVTAQYVDKLNEDAKQGAGQVSVKPNWIANCCKCGRLVDTREKVDGGDGFGTEIEGGSWTCSFDCWEAVVDPEHSALALVEKQP